jgi:hypothetical protein
MQFMNRFNWIGQQQDGEDSSEIYLLCKSELANGTRCSHIYKKDAHKDDTCPICGTYAAIDIYKERKLENSLNEKGLHRLFFERVPKVFDEMDLSVWNRLGSTAWKSANAKEQVFLAFCMAFTEVSGEKTDAESEYWDAALATEASIRAYLVEKNIQIIKQENFDLSLIADGMLAGRMIRTLQAHYGISLCGTAFQSHSRAENERKYQKAIRIAERLAILGCSSRDNLPYFNAARHLAA